jgi:PelA/Pel-15E family pectate lyase
MKKLKILLVIFFNVILTSCYAQLPKDSVADKMLVYQLGNGGWPKQLEDKSVVNYSLPFTPELLSKIKATGDLHATFDNKATSREVIYLVKAFKKTQNKTYLKAAEKGLDYILEAQYANGGWPQYYPDKALYRAEITYNDDAMINVLNILEDVAKKANDFEVVNPIYIPKAEKAVAIGLDCIIKTQYKQNGNLSIWAAQYDKDSMLPAKARNFEPASLSTNESVSITRFLMRFKNPSAEIKTAIKAALTWFDQNKTVGYKYDDVIDNTQPNGKDRKLIIDSSSIVWARFYSLDGNIPIFGDRDNTIKTKVTDLSYERRNGYAWYGTWPRKLIEKDYQKWLITNAIK